VVWGQVNRVQKMLYENKRVTRNNSAPINSKRATATLPITKAAPACETNKLRRDPSDSIFAFRGVINGVFSRRDVPARLDFLWRLQFHPPTGDVRSRDCPEPKLNPRIKKAAGILPKE
jgi:hypothetical protein